MSSNAVILNKAGHVAHIILNRPGAQNSINQDLAQELADVCEAVNQDNDIYVVVITGAGADIQGTAVEDGRGFPPLSVDPLTDPVIQIADVEQQGGRHGQKKVSADQGDFHGLT